MIKYSKHVYEFSGNNIVNLTIRIMCRQKEKDKVYVIIRTKVNQVFRGKEKQKAKNK